MRLLAIALLVLGGLNINGLYIRHRGDAEGPHIPHYVKNVTIKYHDTFVDPSPPLSPTYVSSGNAGMRAKHLLTWKEYNSIVEDLENGKFDEMQKYLDRQIPELKIPRNVLEHYRNSRKYIPTITLIAPRQFDTDYFHVIEQENTKNPNSPKRKVLESIDSVNIIEIDMSEGEGKGKNRKGYEPMKITMTQARVRLTRLGKASGTGAIPDPDPWNVNHYDGRQNADPNNPPPPQQYIINHDTDATTVTPFQPRPTLAVKDLQVSPPNGQAAGGIDYSARVDGNVENRESQSKIFLVTNKLKLWGSKTLMLLRSKWRQGN